MQFIARQLPGVVLENAHNHHAVDGKEKYTHRVTVPKDVQKSDCRSKKKMANVGIEPTTLASRDRISTTL